MDDCIGRQITLFLRHLTPTSSTSLKAENTVFEINGYAIEDNQDKAYAGRNLMLNVGAITCIFPNFPEHIGQPKDIFDALNDGPVQYSNIPTHPLLRLTPRVIDGIFTAKPKARQVFSSLVPLTVQVTRIAKLNADVWFVVVFDGAKECMAVLWTMLHLEKMGIERHLKNNLLEMMTDNRDALQEGDVERAKGNIARVVENIEELVVFLHVF